jgi:hypothetical protein
MATVCPVHIDPDCTSLASDAFHYVVYDATGAWRATFLHETDARHFAVFLDGGRL